jgi:hypothetical protein
MTHESILGRVLTAERGEMYKILKNAYHLISFQGGTVPW